MNRWVALTAGLALGLVTAQALAGIVVTSGTVRASVRAYADPTTVTDSQELPLNLTGPTSVLADAVAVGSFYSSHGRAEATVAQDVSGALLVDSYTDISGGTFLQQFNAGAGTFGSIFFSTTQTETLSVLWTRSSDLFATGSFSLKDASGVRVTYLTNGKTVPLAPDQYSIDWSVIAETRTGIGNPVRVHFAVSPIPEPAGLSLLLGASLALTRRRRR
jgi:hypothetical protein